ncbi:hypothetical protein LJ737_08230 [Hymenobacter sp. 15J16-1T3B]|uniref:hypothetical protein n=1 Tax=Hymenobacter sp. 15J16-1T3B TaxID=2886941 RepID=UPI001D10914F|nr:hypothetical protein [Hymenobacter sp. 15J16-1T3B]MCC3157222.1 hypothetical protein [Hymenobacter sp. 15J16-1T3B]
MANNAWETAAKAVWAWLRGPVANGLPPIAHPRSAKNNPGRWVDASADWRITERSSLATPLTTAALQHWQESTCSYARLRVDEYRRLYLDLRFDWPADSYFGREELQATEADAAACQGVYLAAFRRYADDTAELVVKQSPGFAGSLSLVLEGVTAAEWQRLQSQASNLYNWLPEQHA